jgi:hypothetical protein
VTRTLYALVAAAGLAGACGHAKDVESRGKAERATAQSKPIQSKPGRPIVSAQPKKVFQSKTVNQIQRRLGVKETGDLDDATQKALTEFQREHKLPATGFPDSHTLEEMGIKADEAQKQAGSKKERKRADEAEGERAKKVDTDPDREQDKKDDERTR